jgi:hypothetical protein
MALQKMSFPWEPPRSEFERYRAFMDSHVRIGVSVNGGKKAFFSILDNGTKLETDTNGVLIKIEGHPRTTDPVLTVSELVNYIIDSATANVKSQ